MEENINKEALKVLKEQSFGGNTPTLQKELKKVFKGKTEFTLDYSTPEKLEACKRDRHFHQRMLRAYLKGKETFNFGFNYNIDGTRFPIEHNVLLAWE